MRLVAVVTAASLGFVVGPAQAQDRYIDVERFKPAVTHDGFVVTEGSAVRPEADRWEVGLYANYALAPLVVVDGNDVQNSFVGHRVGYDLLASATVVGPFAIGLDVPFFGPQLGDADPTGGGLGDLRLVPKIRILDDRESVGLAITAGLGIPTHVGDFSGGARMISFDPRLVFDHRFWRTGWRIGANAGVTLREGTEFINVNAASEFSYAAAVGYRFGGPEGIAEVGVEANGGVGLTAADLEELPLEGRIYAKIDPHPEWEISFGPGMGLLAGYGVPTFRAFVGVRWRPTDHDRDDDGIPDDEDQCPDRDEDRDGDEDLDGCPEDDPDSDSDGIPDREDDCPDEKETINGVEDDDGCPDGGPAKVRYERGKIVILEQLYFQTGSANVDPRSHSMLNQVALVMKANKDIEHLRVEGHTDDTGDHDMNVKLSQQRADSVRRYLIAQGIDPDRVTAKGFGPDQPLESNDTLEGRAKNRRVEFIVEQ